MNAFPAAGDYYKAVQAPSRAFTVPTLQAAQFVWDSLGPTLARGSSAVVFQASVEGKPQALRCYIRNDASSRDRYSALNTYLASHDLSPYVSGATWLDEAIVVNRTPWPVLTMEWIDGRTLNEYVDFLVTGANTAALTTLAVRWRELVALLQRSEFGHGDRMIRAMLRQAAGNHVGIADRLDLFQAELGCEIGFHPARDHRVRQRQGRPQPQRKQRRDAGAVELLLAVGLDILKEQIAEDDVGDALADGAGHGFAHSRLVDRVWAGIGYRHDARRQSRCIQLRPQNLLPHAVDRYPVERLGHRRQRADNIEFTRAPDLVQRERAVLAARPRDQCLRPRLFQLIGAPTVRRRCFGTRAGGTAGWISLSAPILRSAASAARSPLSQAPSTVPH